MSIIDRINHQHQTTTTETDQTKEIHTAMIDTKVETMIGTTTTNPRIGIAIEIDKTTVNDPSQEKIDAIQITAEEVHRDNDTTTAIDTPNTLDNERLHETIDNETTQETATIVATTLEIEVNRLINRQTIDEQQRTLCN